jgi:hypothetical protein
MDAAAAVRRVYDAVDRAAACTDVARLCGYDRYQSSAGIGAAADYVAERAAAAGLSDVQVLRLAAADRRWWTFRGPPAWTPARATLALATASGRPLRTVVGYPAEPYTLAAYSAATPPGGVVAPLRHRPAEPAAGADLRGTVVLLDGCAGPAGPGVEAAAAAGAVAAVVRSTTGGRSDDRVGRIELPPGSPLAAFSVGAGAWQALADWARIGGRVRVEVSLAAGADLPVVTGRLPGRSDAELLLSAHLCHPRPSANDNASGVAALLALIPALRPGGPAGPSVGPGLGVRFVWGPEFLGLAAYLHDVVGAGAAARPVAAVNVDMAGEDQRRCGGPLIVERSPDDLPSYLNAVVEGCAAALPQAGRSYSGAVGCDTWAWRATPFVGASDHLLVVEPPTSRPAVSLGHWPDRFNHSSADTLDKVDPDELGRTATVAGAAVTMIRAAADGRAGDLLDAVVSWSAGRLLDCLAPALHSGPPLAGRPDPADLLRHRAAVATGSVRAVGALAPGATSAVAAAERWLAELAGQLGRRLADRQADDRAGRPADARAGDGAGDRADEPAGARAHPGHNRAGRRAGGPLDRPPAAGAAGVGLARGWSGPFNLRALTERAGAAERSWLAAELGRDRGGGYARMVAVARALDGRRDRPAVLAWAAAASELPIPPALGERLLAVLGSAGWAVPAPAHRPGNQEA